jgi:hypothetical protein
VTGVAIFATSIKEGRITMANAHNEAAFALKLSRRACLQFVAAVTLSPAVVTRAQAQGDVWQMYRREDLGFEIEMPGKPRIEVEENQGKDDPRLRAVDAQANFEETLFGAHYEEYKQPTTSIEEEVAAQRVAAEMMGSKIVSETTFTTNGFPGVEIVFDGIMGGTDFTITRIVVAQNRRFFVSAIGPRSGKDSPSVRRFFDSFKLLPAGR